MLGGVYIDCMCLKSLTKLVTTSNNGDFIPMSWSIKENSGIFGAENMQYITFLYFFVINVFFFFNKKLSTFSCVKSAPREDVNKTVKLLMC